MILLQIGAVRKTWEIHTIFNEVIMSRSTWKGSCERRGKLARSSMKVSLTSVCPRLFMVTERVLMCACVRVCERECARNCGRDRESLRIFMVIE